MIYISSLLGVCKYKYFCVNMKLISINFYFSALNISTLYIRGGEDNEFQRNLQLNEVNYSRVV
jgi:hypothetical protein